MKSYSWLQEKFDLTEEGAAVVEWQYGFCGGFRTALWEVICRADDHNLNLLAKGFPVEVEGYTLYTCKPNWWQEVQKQASKKIQ